MMGGHYTQSCDSGGIQWVQGLSPPVHAAALPVDHCEEILRGAGCCEHLIILLHDGVGRLVAGKALLLRAGFC